MEPKQITDCTDIELAIAIDRNHLTISRLDAEIQMIRAELGKRQGKPEPE